MLGSLSHSVQCRSKVSQRPRANVDAEVSYAGHPASLQDLGFGRGRYAEELSQLR